MAAKKRFVLFTQKVNDQMCQKQFSKFCHGDILLSDAPCLGKSVDVESKNNQHYTTYKIANIVKIFKWRREENLHQFGYVSHWLPKKTTPHLKKTNLGCISVYGLLFEYSSFFYILNKFWEGKQHDCNISWWKQNDPTYISCAPKPILI